MNEDEESGQEVTEPAAQAPGAGFRRVTWAAWWIGAILIVLSWTEAVSRTVGWIGFCICGVSVIANVIVQRFWRMPR